MDIPSFATRCEEAARKHQEIRRVWETIDNHWDNLVTIIREAKKMEEDGAAMARENDSLRHDIERHISIAGEYARDAERYRWLRENIHASPWRNRQPYLMVADDFGGITALHHFVHPLEADAAIDAAIDSSTREKGGGDNQ